VRRALSDLAASRSSATVALAHNCLVRAIRHAESGDHVRRNVAALVKPPPGQAGRPSRAMTSDQATALLGVAQGDEYLGAYVILSLTTGIRTEEARALRWDHVSLDGDPAAGVPPHMAVWRSVRAGSDTKTERSRRTLGLPQSGVGALREQRKRRAAARPVAGELWQDHGLVFTSSTGKPLDDANVRRGFRALCEKAGIGCSWVAKGVAAHVRQLDVGVRDRGRGDRSAGWAFQFPHD
jgi:integrase